MGQKKNSQKQSKLHPAQTAMGYITTGLIMWLVSYMLSILAVDSGSLLQWLGVIVAFVWGGIRLAQGLAKHFIKQ